MKKVILLLMTGIISACASGLNLYPERSLWVESFSTYPIHFFSGEPELANTEYVEEKSVKSNTALKAYAGYSVLSNKTYQVQQYRELLLKPNENGVMNSASVPGLFFADKPVKIIGTTIIDGVEYRLVPSELNNFVFMIKPNGEVYDEMGQIRNKRLAILEATFVPTPETLRLLPVKNAKTVQTKPVKGFDIKFDGVRDGKIWFTYLDYKQAAGEGGEFENLGFPNKDGIINIKGNKIKILSVDNQKLDYMVLQ